LKRNAFTFDAISENRKAFNRVGNLILSIKKIMKKKFNLGDLKVKSFVTSLENKNYQTIAGGGINSAHNVFLVQISDKCLSELHSACCPRTHTCVVTADYETQLCDL
jgi:hypothetical protein